MLPQLKEFGSCHCNTGTQKKTFWDEVQKNEEGHIWLLQSRCSYQAALLSHLSHPFFCDWGFAAPCRPTGYILDPFWRAAKVQQPRWPWTKKFAMARNKSWRDSKNGGVLSLTYTPFWEGITNDYETETQPLTKRNLLENFRVNFRVKDECPDLSPCHPHVSIIMSTTFWARVVRVWEQ